MDQYKEFCRLRDYRKPGAEVCRHTEAEAFAMATNEGSTSELQAELARLAVGVHANDDGIGVAVHLKQGEHTTVLYTQSHSANHDSCGIVNLPASLFAAPATARPEAGPNKDKQATWSTK